MDQPSSIKLFKENNIRYVWDEENEDLYFSIEDFILFLTDCANSDEYILKKCFPVMKASLLTGIQYA